MNTRFPDFYDTNLEALKKYHPEVWRQVTETQPEPVGNILPSATGKPNLMVMSDQGNSIFLHDEKDPEKDYANFVKRIPEGYQGFVAVLGLGLGYGITGIFKERPLIQKLAIFELEPGIFIQTLRYNDLSQLLSDSRTLLRIGSEPPIETALKDAQTTIRLEDSQILNHLPSFDSNIDGYTELKAALFSHLNSLNIEGTTTKKLGKSFIDNRFKHISTIRHHHIIDQIQNIYSDKPAIIVAGGPSLDKNISLLKEAAESAVIIAVDTVLPTLLDNGVSPHFLTSIDPNNITFEKFAGVISKATAVSLVCASSVNLKTAKNFPAKQIFWTFKASAIEGWLNHLLGGRINTSGASTVAHLNLITASILGCDPIVFIGQDLAYSNDATHAKGTVLHGSAPQNVVEQNSDYSMTKGIDGQMVRTDRGFLSMKNHFENMIKNTPGTFINATEGGAHIEGTHALKLREVIDQHCTEKFSVSDILDNHLKNIPPLSIEKMETEFNALLKSIKTVQKKVKQSDKLSGSLLKELKHLKNKRKKISSFDALAPSQKKQIQKMDRLQYDLDHTEKIWHLLEEVTLQGIKEGDREKQAIAMLAENPAQYANWLTNNVLRIENINKVRKQATDQLLENIHMVLDFIKQESTCLDNMAQNTNPLQSQLDLTRLYAESGNINMARPLLENLCKTLPESGEVHFLMGCVQLQLNEPSTAETHFKTAVKIEAKFQPKIDAYRQSIGDEFVSFVEHFKKLPNRDASIKYSLRKGLLVCPEHMTLKTELNHFLTQDIAQIKSDIDQGDYQKTAALIEEWHDHISENEYMFDCIAPEKLSDIFYYHGKLNLSRQQYQAALESFNKALSFSPDNHDLHFMLIDTYFISQDFTGGIEALNWAITVDVNFAAYWETIGDQLQAGDQHEDAISAYERCFQHLPEKIGILKKIGDCYMAVGNLEAAKTAYEILKQKLETAQT